MLASTKSTTYQHRTDIDETVGRVNCDCSGLLGYVLRTDFPEAYLAVQGDEAPWKSRPLSVTYFETIERDDNNVHSLWRQIPRLMDAQPGDVLAWRKKNIVRGSTTGHVCIIDSVPFAEASGLVKVRVIDSTRAIHENDTRPDQKTGFGSGFMWFEVDADGRPTAFTIRHASRKIGSNRILIGRVQGGRHVEIVTNADDRGLVGLAENVARDIAKRRGLKWRIIERDGEAHPIPLSRHDPTRLNAVIEDGNVMRLRRG